MLHPDVFFTLQGQQEMILRYRSTLKCPAQHADRHHVMAGRFDSSLPSLLEPKCQQLTAPSCEQAPFFPCTLSACKPVRMRRTMLCS